MESLVVLLVPFILQSGAQTGKGSHSLKQASCVLPEGKVLTLGIGRQNHS